MANVTGWYAEVSTAVTVPRMSATGLLKPPTLSTVSPFVVAPPRMSATATMPTPGLVFSTTIAAPRMSANGVMAVPTVANFLNAAVTSPRMAATAAMAVPAVTVDANITAPRMAATASMAIPVVATINGANYTDNFNRSNSSTLGADWNVDAFYGTGLAIVSNAAVAAASPRASIYTFPMSTGNNQITVVMKGTPATNDIAFINARMNHATSSNTATTFVQIGMIQNNLWYFSRYKVDAGLASSGNLSWSDGDTIVFSCVGGVLTVKKNGSTVFTTTGATDLGAGYIELGVFSNSATSYGFDSFTAQDI